MSVQEFPSSLRPPVRQPFPWRTLLIGFGLALVMVLVIVLAGVVRQGAAADEEQARMAAFTPHVEAWFEHADAAQLEGPARLRGALVVVDGERRAAWPWILRRLDQRLVAATPAEVGTVVLCDIEWRPADDDAETGKRGGEAWTGWVHVTLLDPARHEILGRHSFENRRPVHSTTRTDDQLGGLPMWDVLAWLHRLPRS